MSLNVDYILKKKGLTRADLARLLGKTPSTLSNTLNKNPGLKTLERIAEVLEVELINLFDGGNKENSLEEMIRAKIAQQLDERVETNSIKITELRKDFNRMSELLIRVNANQENLMSKSS